MTEEDKILEVVMLLKSEAKEVTKNEQQLGRKMFD